MTTQAMTEDEQVDHDNACLVVRNCLSALRLVHLPGDEDIEIAKARDNWLTENDKRWVR